MEKNNHLGCTVKVSCAMCSSVEGQCCGTLSSKMVAAWNKGMEIGDFLPILRGISYADKSVSNFVNNANAVRACMLVSIYSVDAPADSHGKCLKEPSSDCKCYALDSSQSENY
ncbi:unnamed protein product [Calicophoron daubneyi]|uniref:Uncharacterized protein n=1 Tax=Calicophoron daubneyi TaxID=300641 RepID=A0AAV2TQ34_CALDB